MAPHLRIAKTDVPQRDIGDWADTETSRDITRTLELVRSLDDPAITMIAGGPGIGKTMAVKRFCRGLGYGAFYMQAACGEGTAWNLAKCLERELTYPNSFTTLAQARIHLGSRLGHCAHLHKRRVVVMDEAQYLYQKNKKTGKNGEALEWLRALSEEGQFSLVLVGDMNLPAAIQEFPQLQSRMVRPVIIPSVTRSDVAALVEGTSLSVPAAIDTLHAVAQLEGGLRNVENVLRIAYLFSGNDSPTVQHLHAAILDMKLEHQGDLQ